MGEAIRVKLLGGFHVFVGNHSVAENGWRLRKAASLVKLLALAPGHRLHRERVMDLLWPELGLKAASNNLRQAMYVARRTLKPISGCLVLRDEQLVLYPEGDLWVDINAFREAALEARRTQEPAAYRAALNLYAGELLPGDLYEEWAEERRGELHNTYLSLLVELSTLLEERDDLGAAIETLKRAVVGEPTHEEAHAGIIRLYAISGRSGEALAHYERLREELSQGFAAEPGAEIQRVYEEVLSGRTSPTQSYEDERSVGKHASVDAPNNLPAARTSFVGREREMLQIQRELAMTRLLTLTGPGGTGKTRLALEVARDLVGAYPDGVWLVELAGLSEAGLVTQTVADVLGVEEQPDRPLIDSLIDSLREKKVLLVLDNCEHLVGAAARLTEALLASCTRLRMLATSREALGVSEEIQRPVPTLSSPDAPDGQTVEELNAYESVRLFVERALFVERTLYGSPGFTLAPDNARSVAEICQHLEGMPLAIELAAAWVGTLTVDEISERLRNSLRLLKSGSQSVTVRQRTLRGAIDWSYELLSEPEQELFGRLSVFAGGWTLEAVEALGAGGNVEEEEVLDLLWRLANKSLVVVETGAEGAARYRMLEPIRQYAREKLGASGEAEAVRGRHAAFFLALAEKAEPELAGPRQRLLVERLEGEHDNLREVLSWVLERGQDELALRLCGMLWRFWAARGHLSEGVRSLERALAGSDLAPASSRVKALEGLGWLLQRQGNYASAKAAYEELLGLSRELGDKGNVATALNSLGTMAAQQGDAGRARALLEENLAVLGEMEDERDTATPLKRFHALGLLGFLALNEEDDAVRATALFEQCVVSAREAQDALRVGVGLAGLAFSTLVQGDYERARSHCEEALALARDLGSAGGDIVPEALINRGLAALYQADHECAKASFEEALAMGRNLGRTPSVINALEGMASLAGASGKFTRAAHLWGAAEVAREATGIALPASDRTLHEPHLSATRYQLGEATWEEALAEGRAMPLEEAAEYAHSGKVGTSAPLNDSYPPEQETPPNRQPPNLTRREKEIAALVARGLTSRQIASDLVLSVRTVDKHVANILKKLGLRSREQMPARVAE